MNIDQTVGAIERALPATEMALTFAFSAGALALLYSVSAMTTGSRLGGILVALPLCLSIPWQKEFPALGDASTLFSALAVLWLWLAARRDYQRRSVAAFAGLLAVVFFKPELALLALACLAAQVWRADDVSVDRKWRAIRLVVAAAAASAVLFRPIDPYHAVSGLVERIQHGTVWDGSSWVLAGTNIRTSIQSAESHGATFYIPLLVPFAVLSWKYRNHWWYLPVMVWAGTVLACTLWSVRVPVLRGCVVLEAALLAACGVPAYVRLREMFPLKRGAERTDGNPDTGNAQ